MKKTKKEIYLDVAERIAENITGRYYVCNMLDEFYPLKFDEFELFEPIKNKFLGSAWFSESAEGSPYFDNIKKDIEGNEARIIALLLCAEMSKNKRK
jgi:hypothetical protein